MHRIAWISIFTHKNYSQQIAKVIRFRTVLKAFFNTKLFSGVLNCQTPLTGQGQYFLEQ